MFWVKTAANSLGHLLKVSVTCINNHKRCCYPPFSLSLVYNDLHNVYWLALKHIFWAYSIHCVKVCFCDLVFFCESSIFLSWNLVLYRNNRMARLTATDSRVEILACDFVEIHANLVLSTFAEVQGDWFYQDSFYFVQVCIPCLIKFLLSSAYKCGACFQISADNELFC